MDLNTDQLLQVAFDAATTSPSDLPDGLVQRGVNSTMAGTKALRHPGWASSEESGISPLSAFITTAAELADLIENMAPADWSSITRIEGVTVREVVQHLVGVERYLLGQIGRRSPLDAPRREDHWPVSRSATANLDGEPDSVVAHGWWLEVMDLIAACGELGPDYELAYHHLAGSLRGLLVVRTFELWTHGDDIRQAVGQPFTLLDKGRLSLMVDELMRVLPFGLALSSCAQPGRTARINLTGPGGGTFDVSLSPDEAPGEPDITLTADVMDLCRLASNRLAPEDFEVLLQGEEALLQPILVGAAAFAAD